VEDKNLWKLGCMSMFVVGLLTIANLWISQGTQQPMNRKGKLCLYHGLLLSHKEKWNRIICRKVYGTGDQFEWDKPSSNGHVMFLFICEPRAKKMMMVHECVWGPSVGCKWVWRGKGYWGVKRFEYTIYTHMKIAWWDPPNTLKKKREEWRKLEI
jgi:hypothetical protein